MIENAKSIKLVKEPQEWGRHWNGGDYAYYIYLNRENPNQRFTVTYDTSSEFSYCNLLGEFRECRNCGWFNIDSEECTCQPETITEKEAEIICDKYIKNGWIMEIKEF